MKALLFACLVLAASAPTFAQAPVTVYVFTQHDPNGLVALDDTSKDRLAAVEDFKKRLAKQAGVQCIDTDTARVTVEVVSAGMEWTREGAARTTYVGGGTAVTTPGKKTPTAVARATIKSGDFATTIEASMGPLGRSYGENLARKFEDWLNKNRQALTR